MNGLTSFSYFAFAMTGGGRSPDEVSHVRHDETTPDANGDGPGQNGSPRGAGEATLAGANADGQAPLTGGGGELVEEMARRLAAQTRGRDRVELTPYCMI
jgi:hypothetical protein